MLYLKIVPSEVGNPGPGLKSPEQLRLARCSPDERIHLDRYLCKVVLDKDVLLAVETDIQLRLTDPADLRFPFL